MAGEVKGELMAGPIDLDEDDLTWYVARCYSGAEWQARKALLKRGIEAFLPWHIAEVRRNHWFQGEIRPMFKGYIFAGLELGQESEDVKQTPGVINVLKVRDQPVRVSESQLHKLRLQAAEAQMVSWGTKAKIKRVRVGDWVPVPKGKPFAGIPVEIEAIDKRGRVKASLGTLGEVEFHLSDLSEEPRRPLKAIPQSQS